MEMFLSVARSGSFTETARAFGVSATSVSRVITDLEERLRVRLLIRSTRQVALSEAGQEYAAQIESVLWSIRDIEDNVSSLSSRPEGALRVHSRTMFGLKVLTPLIAEFRSHFPEIWIELLLGETKVDLRREGVDVDFRIAPPAEAGLKRRMLFRSDRHLVAAPAYLDRAPPLRCPAELTDHACLAYLLPGAAAVWRFRQPGADTEEIRFAPRHVSNNGMALLELARLGEGIALLDDYTVAEDVAHGRLIRLLPETAVSNTTFEEGMFATILDTPLVPSKLRVFLDFVSERVSGRQNRFNIASQPG